MTACAAETIATKTAKLNLGDTNDNNPFASDIEVDLEEDEAVIEDE